VAGQINRDFVVTSKLSATGTPSCTRMVRWRLGAARDGALLHRVRSSTKMACPVKPPQAARALPFPQINIWDARFKEKSLSIHCYQQIFTY
jgi:hypothetical protein